MQQLAEAHHLVIEVDPVVHFAELDVAHDMIDGGQAGRLGFVLDRFIGRSKDAFVIPAVHEHMLGFAIGVDRGGAENAEVILLFARAPGRFAAPGRGRLPGFFDIVHFQGDDLDPISVDHVMGSDLAGGRVGRGNNKPRLPRFKNIRSKSAVACFKPGVGNGLETECLPPVVHGMFGIAHIEVNVVNGFDLQEIRLLGHGA